MNSLKSLIDVKLLEGLDDNLFEIEKQKIIESFIDGFSGQEQSNLKAMQWNLNQRTRKMNTHVDKATFFNQLLVEKMYSKHGLVPMLDKLSAILVDVQSTVNTKNV